MIPGMPSCREVTLAVAGEGLERASVSRRVLVRLHLLMCRHCRRYVAQMRTLAAAARALATSPTGDGEGVERLRRVLVSRIGSSDTDRQ